MRGQARNLDDHVVLLDPRTGELRQLPLRDAHAELARLRRWNATQIAGRVVGLGLVGGVTLAACVLAATQGLWPLWAVPAGVGLAWAWRTR